MTKPPYSTYFLAHEGGLQWSYSYSFPSVFDPAHLGEPYVALSAGGDAQYNTYPDSSTFDTSTQIVTPHVTFDAYAGASACALLFDSRLSITGAADGFSYFLATDGAKYTPYRLPTIGGGGYFSGYPAGYATVNDLAHASLEILTSPAADANTRAEWYQRMSFGARINGGIVRYFAGGLKVDYPLSAEVSFRHYFYLHPNSESSSYLRFAVPLNDFLHAAAPFQIYAGYSY